MQIFQNDGHILSFINMSDFDYNQQLMQVFERFENEIGYKMQEIIAILSSPVPLYQVKFKCFGSLNINSILPHSLLEI